MRVSNEEIMYVGPFAQHLEQKCSVNVIISDLEAYYNRYIF